MQFNNLTTKAQEVLFKAQELAAKNSHPQVDSLHLLYALISQEGSVVLGILNKLGTDISLLKERTLDSIEHLPKNNSNTVSLGRVYVTEGLAKIFDNSIQMSVLLKKIYLSTEHLFLAFFEISTQAR